MAERATPNQFDVVIIGAGISGIDMAYRVKEMLGDRTYAVLEARERIGGTWDLFRYPGVRSDSDMYTLGFPFAPWTGEASISDGESIRTYLTRTAARFGIDEHIQFSTRVTRLMWDSDAALWTLEAETPRGPDRLTARWVHLATGYYSYEEGYAPHFEAQDTFAGRLVHPQFWPEDVDVRDQRVVVIGSGATAITLVPALAAAGAKVTMLQRTPSWVVPVAARDRLAAPLVRRLGVERASGLIRGKNVVTGRAFYRFCRSQPALARRVLSRVVARRLADSHVDPAHFAAPYDPWDQRICATPDGDFFDALLSGDADIVTDTVERLEPGGVRTGSGEFLAADVIVTATGLVLRAGGGAHIAVDGTNIDIGQQLAYRGLMLSDVPNLSMSIGYANASWTLRADLAARYVCRLIRHTSDIGAVAVRPLPPRAMERRPILSLNSGYARRGRSDLPDIGDSQPWTVTHNYLAERRQLPRADLDQDMAYQFR